jgi:UPF0755 protein
MEKIKMARNRGKGISNGLIGLLVLIMVGLLLAILWVGIPLLAEEQFGPAAAYLTPTQKWSYSFQVVLAKNSLLSPACQTSKINDFIIETGSSVNQIVNKLQQAGLIEDAASLRSYLIYKGLDTQILAGNYQLDCAQNSIQIADSIKNIYQDEVIFNILPGWRAEEIAAALPSSGIEVTPEDFLSVVRNPSDVDIPAFIPPGKSLDGLLFPTEYTISRKISAVELVQTFVDRFVQQAPESLIQKSEANGLTPYQTIILASIVQRETFAAEERPLMSSVFYNRLAQGMRLETDPTVQYALGYDASWGWWKSPLTGSDLQIQSDYNTYLINGLPPAPIANPDLASLDAVLNPSDSSFLYFRAKCDNSGTHVFAATFEEHVANSCK